MPFHWDLPIRNGGFIASVPFHFSYLYFHLFASVNFPSLDLDLIVFFYGRFLGSVTVTASLIC